MRITLYLKMVAISFLRRSSPLKMLLVLNSAVTFVCEWMRVGVCVCAFVCVPMYLCVVFFFLSYPEADMDSLFD